jgi:hypothetical protein
LAGNRSARSLVSEPSARGTAPDSAPTGATPEETASKQNIVHQNERGRRSPTWRHFILAIPGVTFSLYGVQSLFLQAGS